jgi:hypothetical protein
LGLREDAVQAAEEDRGTAKVERDEATLEVRDKFAEWCAAMGIEKIPALAITKETHTDNVPEVQFRTLVDDVELRGRYLRGEKLRMTYGETDREVNSLADLGRAVRAEDGRQ